MIPRVYWRQVQGGLAHATAGRSSRGLCGVLGVTGPASRSGPRLGRCARCEYEVGALVPPRAGRPSTLGEDATHLHVRISDAQLRALRRLARQAQEPMSVYVRGLIAQALADASDDRGGSGESV